MFNMETLESLKLLRIKNCNGKIMKWNMYYESYKYEIKQVDILPLS